jgi:hypothetical protein
MDALPVEDRADDRLRGLDQVKADNLVPDLAKHAQQTLAKMSGTACQ